MSNHRFCHFCLEALRKSWRIELTWLMWMNPSSFVLPTGIPYRFLWTVFPRGTVLMGNQFCQDISYIWMEVECQADAILMIRISNFSLWFNLSNSTEPQWEKSYLFFSFYFIYILGRGMRAMNQDRHRRPQSYQGKTNRESKISQFHYPE